MLAEEIFVGAVWHSVLRHNSGMAPINLFGQSGGISFRNELARDFGEIRIAQPIGAVGKRKFHRFRHNMNEVGGVWAHRLQVKVFQDIQDLGDVCASRTGRREADDLVTAIHRRDRLAQFRVVVAKIFRHQQASVPFHPVRCDPGERPAIKPVDAVLRDGAISSGQVRQPQNLPGPFHPAVGKKRSARRFEPIQLLCAGGQSLGVMAVERETVLRDFCRSHQMFLQRKFSVATERVIVSRQRARHTGRQRPGETEFGNDFAVPYEHVARGRTRRGFATVDGDERPIGKPNQHETTSADARVVAVHDPERQRRGRRCVDGIAALLESFNCCLGRQRMNRRHDAAFTARRFAAGVKERNAKQRRGPGSVVGCVAQ